MQQKKYDKAEGTLKGATLDVFPTEPLSVASPLWLHPQVTVTPHNAGWSAPRSIVGNILRQIDRINTKGSF